MLVILHAMPFVTSSPEEQVVTALHLSDSIFNLGHSWSVCTAAYVYLLAGKARITTAARGQAVWRGDSSA